MVIGLRGLYLFEEYVSRAGTFVSAENVDASKSKLNFRYDVDALFKILHKRKYRFFLFFYSTMK